MSRALGRYELLRPLARGGMAEVFLARRRAAGVEKWLVVKRIRAERATDVQFLDLFVREARLSMSLAHQNIVPVFDFGRIDDQVFLAMERVEGRDLGSTLARVKGPISPLLAAFIAAECCQALDYAHRRKSPEGTPLGIVHRDVTPRNVLLSWSGEVKLTDFGIAALAGDATTALLGTPAYMAPEQARKEPLDARTDVYAVGLVLREMLTGERARAGVDRESLVAAARANVLRPWPAHELPPAIVEIVDRATAALPDDRYIDARALLAELDDFLVGERAAKKADAPARQLAAWLDKVWGDERDDQASTSGEIVPDHMVSFLDDGALEALGTGTQRSMLATAGEESAINPLGETLDLNSDVVGASQPSLVVAEPSADSRATASDHADRPAEVSRPETIIEPAGSARWLVLALAALLAVGAVVFVVTRSREQGGSGARGDASIAMTPDTALAMSPDDAVAMAPDAALAMTPDATLAMTPDAALAMTPDAALAAPRDAAVTKTSDASIAMTRDASIATTVDASAAPRDARDPAGLPDAVAASRRRVTVQATPWAYFTVDSDPTRYETPKSVELSPGPHVLHFDNPDLQITRDVRIDVSATSDMQHVEHLQ